MDNDSTHIKKFPCYTCEKLLDPLQVLSRNCPNGCAVVDDTQLCLNLSPICPYCSTQVCHYDDVYQELGANAFEQDGECDITCKNCNKDFLSVTHVEITYTSERKIED